MQLRVSNIVSPRRISIVFVALFWPTVGSTQMYSGAVSIHEVFPGTETETYLHYLDLADTTSGANWSLRALSPPQLDQLARSLGVHPWRERLAGFSDSGSVLSAGLLSPNASVRYNSAIPYGSN